MTVVEIARLCHQVGWRGSNLVLAVAVCLGESEGNPKAFNGRNRDLSYGLFQVNMLEPLGEERRRKYGLSRNEELFLPETNVRVAYDIWTQAGHSFSPWGAYTSGGYKKYGRYEKAKEAVENMSRSVKSLVKLRAEIDAIAPNRSKASDGWIGDPAHASRRSDHNPEPDGTVDARDFTHDPANGADMNDISEQIKDDPRVSYIIWNERIYNPSVGRYWRPYGGSNPHTKHMHVSVLDALQDDESPWLEEDWFSMATMEDLKTAIREVLDEEPSKRQPRGTRYLVKLIHNMLSYNAGDQQYPFYSSRIDRIEESLARLEGPETPE